MKKEEFYYTSKDGKTNIHAIKWMPDNEPKAVLQIVHGMIEYIDRYDDFAKFMANNGYVVVGEDHLGHGHSVISPEYLGYFGDRGNEWIIGDIHQLRQKTCSEYPEIPYMILGHSMGSFLVRQYITEKNSEYAEGLSAVVIMGTGWQPPIALSCGKLISKLSGTRKLGKRSKLIELMAFGTYLKKIENPKTTSDWLTKDEEIVKAYRANPLNSFHFTPNAFYHMFSGMQKAHDINRIKTLPAGLPILLISGADDPVGNWGEAVRKAYIIYSDNTDCEVSIKIYLDDRHEILNETDREQVYNDILDYLNSNI